MSTRRPPSCGHGQGGVRRRHREQQRGVWAEGRQTGAGGPLRGASAVWVPLWGSGRRGSLLSMGRQPF